MEVEKIPANNEKDAAPTEEAKLNNISAAEPGEKNNVEKAEPVIKATEDKDDLISQIEEAVKDKPSLSQNSEEDISKSSADDFLKKIDEIEKEDKSNGEVVKAPEEPPQPPAPAPEPENNKIEEKPSNIEEISSDSVAVVDESAKEESKRTEAMSVDNSEGSSDDVMEVDGDLDKPSSEKMDVVEEKPVESIDVDLEESPKPQDVEIKDAQQSEINDVEIKEVSPEANDVEIKEISDDSNDVEIVENSEKEVDVEQKMKELHGEEKSTPVKDVSELSVEEQVKQLESIAHPQKEEEKPSEEKQKDTDEVDTNNEAIEPAPVPPSAPEKEPVVDSPAVDEAPEKSDKPEPPSEKTEEEPISEKIQEPLTEVEKLNGLPEVSNDAESISDKVEEDKPSETSAVTEESQKEEEEKPHKEEVKVDEAEVKEVVEETKPVEKVPEPKTYNLEISCSDTHVNHIQFTSSIPEESIPTENHTFPDLVDACDFIINKFSAIKKAICPEQVVANESTPKQAKKGGSKASPAVDTPAKSGKRGNKRSLPDDDEVVSTPKKSKKEPQPVVEEDHSNKQRVLAKWVDKKYYAGRVVGEKPNNTFAILFEDGALKNLPRKSIVFAETVESDVLPLKGHEIHALVTEDEYECGVVEKVETVKNETVYHVKCETQTVIVTAMQLYLQEDQAKLINKSVDGEDNASTPSGRGSRNKRAAEVASPSTPEAGFSGGVTGKRSNKRQKRSKLVLNGGGEPDPSDESDISDHEEEKQSFSSLNPNGKLEIVEGVQPELQNNPLESEAAKSELRTKFSPSKGDIESLIGPLPSKKSLFRSKHFLLTCTVAHKPHKFSDIKDKHSEFSGKPFIKSHILNQLEAGGANVYKHFEDIPKNKYKVCKLIAHRPCLTAKYVQCLSLDIEAISHQWVIDCCKSGKLLDMKEYYLPCGWSILSERFIQWNKECVPKGQVTELRLDTKPFTKLTIMIAGTEKDFTEFWSRICKNAGAKVRIIDKLTDVTATSTGIMVTESDFDSVIKEKAQHFGVVVVSTVWVVQSLISGYACPPDCHRELKEVYQDDSI